MPPPRPDKPRLLYMSYKRVGNEIYEEIDPQGRLRYVKRHEAKKIVLSLIRELPEERHNAVDKKLSKAIELRKECARYHLDKPSRSRKFHNLYISFLMYIKIQLGLYKNEQEALVTVKERDPAVDEMEEQPLEEEAQPSDEEVHQANEARSEEDEKPDDNEEPDDEDDEDLTNEQIDFLAFLETLMALVEKAAVLWKEVAEGKLPNWVAVNLSGILLREADSLVDVTRLLDEEKQASGATSPWAAAIMSEDGGGIILTIIALIMISHYQIPLSKKLKI
ncbi:hypothetical protein IFR05_015667 [Cadophora sp. M221]|nr:hypothetical protein IFR05_015667 [Cadophora sp. M221]